MNDKFKDFPLCINCKYFMEGPCGLTMINPVNGELEPRGHRQAFAYRKADNPCGPSGLFFKPKDGKKTQPKKKPVIVEEKKESTAKVIKVETPLMVDVNDVIDQASQLFDDELKNINGSPSDLDPNGVDDVVTIVEEAPKKRRRRAK